MKTDFDAAERAAPGGQLQDTQINDLLPLNRASAFVSYVIATRPALALRGIESLRLNKILQSAAAAGGTSAVSSAIGPALLGAAIEYGGVLQESTGTTTTLRVNALGIAKLAVGAEQFPYCPAIDPKQCKTSSRWLRRVSGSASFEQISAATGKSTRTTPPSASDLLGSDFRVSWWGVRLEITGAGRLDDPAYTRAWTASIVALRGRAEPAAFTAAVGNLFGGSNADLYADWHLETVAALKAATTTTDFQSVFNERMQALADALLSADPLFASKLVAASRAFSGYFAVRDDFIMKAQVHKASLEYTNHSPLNQPDTSNIRFIYSHQPTKAPLVFTLNAALTAYNTKPSEGGPLRDVQAAGQLDRQLGQVPSLGLAVLTLAVYYQWMKDDAVIDLSQTAASALTGLKFADNATTVLGTAGHIVMLQGKVSIPLNDVVKVPISVTWSNRRELVPDTHTMRGQVGLTIDLDGVFK